MGFAEDYFRKQRSFKPSIPDCSQADLGFIVVIPATREKDVIVAIKSLYNCFPIQKSFEIIVLINADTGAAEETVLENRRAFEEIKQFDLQKKDARRRIFPILMEDLPIKDAGVGLARKSGMDEALWRFNLIDEPGGFILCFDADATCDPDYLPAIENHTRDFPLTKGCSIYFEHDIENELFPEYQRKAIISYEIHLRYFKLALRYIGFPYSFHTVGSSMLVNALCYAEQGGMNKHKAGEDFYFLQKIIPLGHFYELNNTRIVLSPRESDRVPFGTGAAIGKMMDKGLYKFETYHIQPILELKELFSRTDSLFRIPSDSFHELLQSLPSTLVKFLVKNDFDKVVEELNQNSARKETFTKRFFQWWNAFRILKYLNFAHRNFYSKIDSTFAAEELLKHLLPQYSSTGNSRIVLETLRNLERNQKITDTI